MKKLIIVFLLGFSSGLPYALLSGALQAWFADSGMSVMQTGLLSLLGLPYAYRFLLAPIIDKLTLFKLGRRRSWMLLTQIFLLIGLNALAWFHPLTHATSLAWFALALSCCSALQDVVIDAQRIEYLATPEHGLGASLAVLGYRLALLVGGGGALVLAYYYGWAWTYRLMGSCMFVGLFATWWSEEPRHPEVFPTLKAKDWWLPVKEWIARPYWLTCLGFIFFYKVGEAFTTTSSGIVMPFLLQGLGFSLDTVGYVNKGVGVVALLTGGLTAGWWLRTKKLYAALFWFGLLQAMSNVMFVLLAIKGKHLSVLVMAVGMDNFAAGMSSTALVTMLMRLVNRQFTATQFSLLIAVSMLPRVFSGPTAAGLQLYLGWVGLYTFVWGFSFLYIPFLWRMRREKGLEDILGLPS